MLRSRKAASVRTRRRDRTAPKIASARAGRRSYAGGRGSGRIPVLAHLYIPTHGDKLRAKGRPVCPQSARPRAPTGADDGPRPLSAVVYHLLRGVELVAATAPPGATNGTIREGARAALALPADPGHQLPSGHAEAAGDLRHGGDTHVADSTLGPRQLDWVNVAAVRGGFLRQALVFADALDVAADDDLGLWHGGDAHRLSRSRPEPMTYG